MYCLDANVWVYFFDSGLDEHDSVRPTVTPVLSDEPLFVTTVLQMEVVHYLTNNLRDSDGAVDRFLALEDTTVAELTESDVDRAVGLLDAYPETGIGGRDATVLAAMERYDVSRLWTHDESLKRLGDRLDWLSVTDPVESR